MASANNLVMGDWDDLEHWEQNQWQALRDVFDADTFQTVAETTTAYITRAQLHDPSRGKVAVAIKSASVDPRFSKQPHDIGKELRILLRLSHFNVIEVLGHTYETTSSTVHFWMPFVSIHVSDILSSPCFSPHVPPVSASSVAESSSFLLVAKSMAYQTLAALEYIHGRGIAHRDVKPLNLLLTLDGRVQLLDFGVAWSEEQDEHDLWPESRGRMCIDVSTGPYRAPELLFGTRDYDPYATDLWSLGAVLAEFFTPLRLRRAYDLEDDWYADDEETDSDLDPTSSPSPFIVPKGLDPTNSHNVEWERDSLFDGTRGQIGLAWSIFKVFGTPTEQTWPTFKMLPDAQKVTFIDVPPADLRLLLPNLPSSQLEDRGEFFDMVVRLLTYPPERRLRASDASEHPLFRSGLPVLLPSSYPVLGDHHRVEWEGRKLVDLLSEYVKTTHSI